jgi:hypothetical protein
MSRNVDLGAGLCETTLATMDSKRDPKDGDAPRRPAKKKRRSAAAASEPLMERPVRKKRRAPVSEPPPPEGMRWTVTHVAAALAVGIGLGGMVGYSMGKGGEGSQKDPAAAAADASAPSRARGAEEEGGRVYVPLASWSPHHGPKHAKVTILDFSDFQ